MEPVSLLYLFALFVITLLSFIYYALAFWGLFQREERPLEVEYTPRVSVHIPVYNDRIVERLLEAVLSFDYPDYEVIVADDSTDPVTRAIVDRFATHPRVKVLRRPTREGFKAGALNNALKHSTGEIIVVFDSDFVPPRHFLREIVKPFKDPAVAYVQARWSFENLEENLITVFAGTSLLIYHHLFYPLKSKVGTIYLSGSAMAVRKSVLEEVGGWRGGTLAEDGEVTMRIASRGYRSVYLPYLRAPNQLPFLLNVFIKQQARWSSGMIEAFLLNWRRVLSAPISPLRKFVLLSIPLLNLAYVVVTLMMLTGVLLWMFRITLFTPTLAAISLLLSSGYLAAGYVALKKEGKAHLFPKFLLSAYVLGPLIAVTNTAAILRYFVRGVPWYVTPKRWR